MLDLFNTLNLGARSLQTQQQGVQTAGQNLANVNNPAYARQRVQIQTSGPLATPYGPVGTGATVAAIQQLRDALVDRQITSETSVGSFLDTQQRALQDAQTALGDQVDRQAASTTSLTSSASSIPGLSSDMNSLFAALKGLTPSPASLDQRADVLSKAQTLATDFKRVASNLAGVRTSLNESVATDVTAANGLIKDIATLNDRIASAEFGGGSANDLRDLRQSKLEDLAKFVNVEANEDSSGTMNLTVGGTLLVSGGDMLDTLQSYDAGGAQVLVRTAAGGASLALTSGSIQGAIDARDGAVATAEASVNSLASLLISEVNTAHAAGYSLTGTTGAAFFTGTDASSLGVNSALVDNPALLQASSVPGANGNNQVVADLAALASKKQSTLNDQTLGEAYNNTVVTLGQALADVKTDQSDHARVSAMLQQQRDSVGGVSIDEEMTNMMKFQKAFEASARLITTVDDMLDTVVNLKR
jgi:flagellar hook-associated protein 1